MKLQKILKSFGYNYVFLLVFIFALVLFLNLYKLGNLVGGVSNSELLTNKATYGWHGFYHNATFLPINVVRSVIFKLFNPHGQLLLRLPNALFGILSVIFYYFIIYFWHGKRTAVLSTILFACSAYTLHISRLATNDIVYYWGLVTLVFNHALFYRYSNNRLVGLLNFFIWGLLITIPGFIFLVALDIILQRKIVLENWKEASGLLLKFVQVILLILWLPLLIISILKFHLFKFYLGLPEHFLSTSHIIKNFFAVPVHLFIRGPQYPDLWLGRIPTLDFFTLALLISGLLFYIVKIKNSRSRWLAALFILSFILIGLGGAVSFSLIIALAYIIAATGLAYILHEWLRVFPNNPLARSIGIGLISLAVAVSCIYNLRSYFVAWRLNHTTIATFSRKL